MRVSAMGDHDVVGLAPCFALEKGQMKMTAPKAIALHMLLPQRRNLEQQRLRGRGQSRAMGPVSAPQGPGAARWA